MPKRNIIWIVAILAGAAALIWITRRQPGPVSAGRPERLRPVADVYEKIQSDYYLPVEDRALFRGAVRGMVEELDEFSTYLPPERIATFRQRMDGFERGLGLKVVEVDGRFEVVSVLHDSPAGRLRIRPGQRILMINGTNLARATSDEVRTMLAVDVGESVELTLWSAARKGRTVELTAAEFRVESVRGLSRDPEGQWGWWLEAEPAIAYVQIREFVDDTPERFQGVFRALDGMAGLVLDLRGNPGGKGTVAVRFADLFLREGLIVKMVHRGGDVERHEAHEPGTLPDVPLVVLVDGRTASGAELLAGALWVHHRAVLVGTRTRGKGCVQSMLDLGGELGMINLTTSQFVLERLGPITREPDSTSWGVAPHVRVAIGRDSAASLRRLRAAAEVRPDPQTQPKSRPVTKPAKPRLPATVRGLLRHDAQLARAVTLLSEPDAISTILAAEREKARLAEEAAASQPAKARNGRAAKRKAEAPGL